MSARVMSPAAPLITRSSMEMMLDSIRRRDEETTQPRDAPPALPARPTSRARLPSSSKRLLRIPRPARIITEEGFDKVNPLEDGQLKLIHDPQPNNETAPLYCQQLKEGAINIQSFVQGERSRNQCNFMHKRSRAAIMIQKNARRWLCMRPFHQHRKNVILLQSVIRGLLARKHFFANQIKLDMNAVSHAESVKWQDTDTCAEHSSQLHHPIVAELQMQVLAATAALKQKEEENMTLQKQLKQYATRWSDYEAKMKAMEESWRKQMASLQENIIIAKKGLDADATSKPRKVDGGLSMGTYDDSEEFLSAENRTPESTPAKHQLPVCASSPLNGNFNAVGLLLLEFEERKEGFDEDAAGILVEAKLKTHSSINPDEELRKLKSRFAVRKKDFSARLRETKCALKKLGGNLEPKAQRTWWWSKRAAAAEC